MKIFDVWNYNGEAVAEARIELLESIVDFFVIVEGTHTFTGVKKPSMFFEKAPFRNHPKVVYVPATAAVQDIPWRNEYYQRDMGWPAVDLLAANEDLVFGSDVDEIPDLSKLPELLRVVDQYGAARLLQDFYYYNFNSKLPYVWANAFVARAGNIRVAKVPFRLLRGSTGLGAVRNGWHISNAMSIEEMQRKLRSFSHTEKASLADDPDLLRMCTSRNINIFNMNERLKPAASDHLPEPLKKFNRQVRTLQGLPETVQVEAFELSGAIKAQAVDTMSHEEDVAEWRAANEASARVFLALMKDHNVEGPVLDAACGDGVATAVLAEQGFEVTGVDVCEEKLDRVRKRGLSASFQDLHHLSFEDGSFGAIHSRHTLEHCYDPAQVLIEFRRVLRTGGLLHLTLPLPDKPCASHVGCEALRTTEDDPKHVERLALQCRFVQADFKQVNGAHGSEGQWVFKAL